jgi:hypothetical protein
MIVGNMRARSVTTALVVCLAVCSGIVPALGAALQQNRAPVITATPEHVTVTGGSGSTKIDWDTGDGSPGFVFVKEAGGKRFLFANGPRGSQVASWIERQRYVFDLYADNDRRIWLARVTVSGSDVVPSPRAVSWHDVARWVLGAAWQQNRAPVITATPEHVTLTGGSGSTKIDWETRDGSPGFVFVTEDGGKRFLFASAPQGSQVASWIGRHRYLFELYGDNDRRTLLAKVTVSGSDVVPSQRAALWHHVARWMLIVGLVAVLYFAFYLSAKGPVRTREPKHPSKPSR